MTIMREAGHRPFTRGATLLVLLMWSVLTSVPAWSAEPAQGTRPSVSKSDAKAIVFTARQAVSALKAAKPPQPPAAFGALPTLVSVATLVWPVSSVAFAVVGDPPSAKARPHSARDPPAV
jgi:hypothetical protein